MWLGFNQSDHGIVNGIKVTRCKQGIVESGFENSEVLFGFFECHSRSLSEVIACDIRLKMLLALLSLSEYGAFQKTTQSQCSLYIQ